MGDGVRWDRCERYATTFEADLKKCPQYQIAGLEGPVFNIDEEAIQVRIGWRAKNAETHDLVLDYPTYDSDWYGDDIVSMTSATFGLPLDEAERRLKEADLL